MNIVVMMVMVMMLVMMTIMMISLWEGQLPTALKAFSRQRYRVNWALDTDNGGGDGDFYLWKTFRDWPAVYLRQTATVSNGTCLDGGCTHDDDGGCGGDDLNMM